MFRLAVKRQISYIGLLICTLLTALLFSACGEEATPVARPTPNPAGYPVPVNPKIASLPATTLKVWFADDYYSKAPIVDLMNQFKQAYPNISFEVDHYEWSRMRRKIKEAVDAGTPPDIAHQHAFTFAAQNYAEPLDDLWQQWGELNKFMPGALEDVTWNNVKYGVPLDINTVFLIYNRQMFKDAGLAVPDASYNYTRLMEDAAKLSAPDGSRMGFAVKPFAWDTYGLIRSNGGELIQEQNGKVTATLNNPANAAILQLISDSFNVQKFSPVPSFTNPKQDPVELFKQGKIAMFFSGPWDLKEIEDNGPKGLYEQVGTAPMPKGVDGKTNGSVQGGGSLFVPKGSKNREAAFEFMKWASSPAYQMRLAREMGRYPVLSALYSDTYFTSQPLLQPFLEQLKTARPYRLEAYALADITWEQTIAAIYDGNNAKTTLEDANRAVQIAINTNKT